MARSILLAFLVSLSLGCFAQDVAPIPLNALKAMLNLKDVFFDKEISKYGFVRRGNSQYYIHNTDTAKVNESDMKKTKFVNNWTDDFNSGYVMIKRQQSEKEMRFFFIFLYLPVRYLSYYYAEIAKNGFSDDVLRLSQLTADIGVDNSFNKPSYCFDTSYNNILQMHTIRSSFTKMYENRKYESISLEFCNENLQISYSAELQ